MRHPEPFIRLAILALCLAAGAAGAAAPVFAQLNSPVGITTDLDGNVWVHHDRVSDHGAAIFRSDGVQADYLRLGGFTDVEGIGRLATVPGSGVLVSLRGDGLMNTINPATGQVTPFLNLRASAVEINRIYDVATARYTNFGGLILPAFSSFNDVAVLRRGDQFDLFVTGLSQAQTFPFIIRVRVTNQGTAAAVVAASSASTAGVSNGARGIAVNAQALVGTTLPMPGAGGNFDRFFTFSADFPETGSGEPLMRLNGVDMASSGMSTDPSGRFYVATGPVGTSLAGPGGSGALVQIAANGGAVTAIGTLDVTVGQSRDTAVSPAGDRVYMTVQNHNAVVVFGITGGQTFSISGAVTQNGAGLPGVTVAAGGGQAVTDASGAYTIGGLGPGSYTVTPGRNGFTFTPASRSVTISSVNVTGQNFTAAAVPATFSISGTVTQNGGGLSGVTVSTGGAQAVTDSGGGYTIANLAPGSYTVTPSRSGYTFSPASRSVTITTAGVAGQNFAAAAAARRGDLNGDGVVDIGDILRLVRVVQGLDPANLAVHDLNSDGVVDIGDILKLVRIVQGLESAPGRLNAGAGKARFTLGSGSADPGGQVTLPLVFAANGGEVAGAQFDLRFDPEKVAFAGAAAGALPPGVQVLTQPLAPGRVQVLMLGVSSTAPFASGAIASITMQVAAGAVPNSRIPVTPSLPESAVPGVRVSDPGGSGANAAGAPGEIAVTGTAGRLVVSRRLNFGTVRGGAARTKKLKLRNAGRGPLEVSLGAPEAPFALVEGPAVFVLAPRERREVLVTYAPSEAGRHAAVLPIDSTDARPDRARVQVGLRGRRR